MSGVAHSFGLESKRTQTDSTEYIGRRISPLKPKRFIPTARSGLAKDICKTSGVILLKILKALWYALPTIGLLLLLLTVSLPIVVPLTGKILPNTENYVTTALQFVKTLQTSYITITQIITPIGNTLMTLIAPLTQGWNEFCTAVAEAATTIWNSICPGGTTGNILEDCPVIQSWIDFINASLDLVKLIWGILKLIYKAVLGFIGALICPGGTCKNPILCPPNKAPCIYDDSTLFTFFFNLVNWFFQRAWAIILVVGAFTRDMIMLPIQLISTISVSNTFPTLQDSALLLPTTTPQYLEVIVLKDILSIVENTAHDITYFILRMVNFIFIIMIDTTQCNFIGYFKQCAAAKACYAFSVVDIQALCVSKTVCLVTIHLDFSWICAKFGLYRSQCPCDQAIYQDTLADLLKPFSEASIQNCIHVYTGIDNLRTQGCQYTDYGTTDVNIWTSSDSGPCLCSRVPDRVDGIWVPCVPAQKACDSSISVIPKIESLTNSLHI